MKKARKRPARTVAMKGEPRGTAMPTNRGAPAAVYPIAVNAAQRAVAPQPLADRYPLVVGQALNASYIGSVFRLATTGYRLQLVDLLNELLEHDPHLFSVLQKRILSTANGRVELTPAPLPKDHPEYDLANEICQLCQYEVDRIPDMAQALAGLLWGVFYGLSCQEIFWNRDADGWHVDRLGFIHSRRLSYPDPQSFDLHIWDQGQVLGWASGWGSSPTNSNVFGLRIGDWPGKFIVHAPQLRGDYPTRDGIGRQVAIWAMFKRLGARGGADYLERFAKSFMDVEYNTPGDDGEGGVSQYARGAEPEDITNANAAAASLGPGSGSFYVHPSSVKINGKSFDGGSSSKLTWPEWISICNAEESKAVLGSTLGTEVGKGGGNRALGEVMERAESDIEGYDAKTLGESLKRDLCTWIVRLNRPECLHLVPNVNIHVDADPDPKSLLEAANQFVNIGAPVDLDALSEETGIALVPNDEKGEDGKPKPRRGFLEKPIEPTQVDSNLMSAEAKQQAADKADQDHKLAKAKLAQPKIVGAPDNAAEAKPAKKSAEADKSAKKLADDRHAKWSLATIAMSDRPDKGAAKEVYEQLLDDYPANALDWILSAHWDGPKDVPTDAIDFSNQDKWRASHESSQPYMDRIEAGKIKPVILVKTPGNPKLDIVDGHHRTLASKKLDRPVCAYVAKVHVDNGPWLTLHNMQSKGSSKGSYKQSRD